ncbi:hypothetical protein AXF42_Ash007355 [Apostasia shenzhenica]|uniref:Reverse transcriptase/retrotransposon-derived protein RNase H-like domain-containing protein n=1 Tax=Apostasia shenzhenica TaxID=1088818 RepID=A0A2I0BA11_9ASPA|nr:hypothetical protein AXF42_Ash007355 [Apostasia shenzhenica]
MPFGLKNAGATYQRIIDTVFKNQRGRNIEAYVDDVLIKSNLPFFKILRGENQAWNEDCAKAFQSLKEYLLSPPLLSASVQDEDLFLYLSATDNSVSAVLVREEAIRQHPIHYISDILHGAKVRYPPLKKTLFCTDLCCP